ncbi:FecR family protein [Larkinella bovis]|uniref:FecR family protein n=1 Tax=Larkinella bovis TaxID=683041 RepID=A0ABW0ID53_9BACT
MKGSAEAQNWPPSSLFYRTGDPVIEMEELLEKYARNECSPEEEQWVVGWLQNPDNESYLRGLMRKQWNNPAVSVEPPPDWQRMWVGITRQTKDLPTEPDVPLYRTIWRQIVRIAVWIGCIIALGLSIRLLRQAQLPADIVYQSGAEQYMRVDLPDQSTVLLNKNSSVRISSDWSGPNRNIWLEGEAVVIVSKQPLGFRLLIHSNAPTDRVITETQQARVYVNYQKQKNQVVVEQGKVNFTVDHSGLLGEMRKYPLQPGDMAEYDEKSTQLIRRHVNSSAYTGWATNEGGMNR